VSAAFEMLLSPADRLLAAIMVSLLAAGLVLLSRRHPNVRETWTLLAAAIKLVLVVSLVPYVLAGRVIESAPLVLAPGLALHLRADAFGLLFALVASGLWLLTSVYSIGYMRAGGYGHQTGYFASFAVCVSATIGVAFAANLLTFFVFYEILTIATYPLVVHFRTEEAMAAGRKYLVYTLVAGQLLLLAIAWTQVVAPGESFQPGGYLAGRSTPAALTIMFILFIAGVGVKAGIMPLHGWLPAAMVAPTPVSALLHAVAVVKAGAFGCVRVVGYVFGVDLLGELGADQVLAAAAGITIIVASLRALGEGHLKRRLAYSTIGQLSYIVLGAALGSVAALAGAMFHIAAHGAMKITMFFCAGAIYTKAHVEQIADLGGIGRRMPITMGAFTICAFGLGGMPLLAGFISKWNLGVGAVEAGQTGYIAVLFASGLLNIGYFFPIVQTAFFGSERPVVFDDCGPALTAPLALTAAAAIVLGIYPDAMFSIFELAWQAAQSATAARAGGLQ
jgi:multicomponent Na+:H+ antiporter subunit D